MKHLVVVRHGNNSGGHLSEIGREQIDREVRRLKAICGGRVVRVLSSPVPWANESAERIANAFGVVLEEVEVLSSSSFTKRGWKPALDLVQFHQNQVDLLILVTHLNYTETIVAQFGREVLGVKLSLRGYLENGGAWVVDCERKELVLWYPPRKEVSEMPEFEQDFEDLFAFLRAKLPKDVGVNSSGSALAVSTFDVTFIIHVGELKVVRGTTVTPK